METVATAATGGCCSSEQRTLLPLLSSSPGKGIQPRRPIPETGTRCDILATASVNSPAPGTLLMSLGSERRSDSCPSQALDLGLYNSSLVRGQELNISC